MEPKLIPKRCKIEVDFQERTKIIHRPSWGHLEAILGHFGRHLEVMFIDFSLVFVCFRANQRF